MLRTVICGLVLAALMLIPATPSFAKKRVALVIGNNAYSNLPALKKAVNDAKAVSSALSAMGYRVLSGENLNRRETNRKLAEFEAALEPGDDAFFFFAGHGVAIGAENYLIPKDMPTPAAGEDGLVRDEAHSVTAVVERIRARGAKSAFVVLDACRDNPFQAKGVRSIGATRGLARVDAPSGVFVLFSAGIGQTALDRLSENDQDPNSVFTRKFVPLLVRPGLSHVRLAKRVQREVASLASSIGHRQEPSYYDQIIGEIVLSGNPGQNGVAAGAALTGAVAHAFEAVKDSTDLGVLQAFLKQFPEGVYAELIKLRIQKLGEQQVAVGTFPEVAAETAATRTPQAGDAFRDCGECPEMVVVPAGRFVIGSPASERDRSTVEGPQRKIHLAKPFAVSRYEITLAQFEAFVQGARYDTGSRCALLTRGGWVDIEGHSFRQLSYQQTSQHPVSCSSWDDAQAYAGWLTGKTGKPYRLLSEAEWEYAARAGSKAPFQTGHAIHSRQANFRPTPQLGQGIYRGEPLPVGQFAGNGFGLHDMHGNVWEWVADCWLPNYRGMKRDGRPRGSNGCIKRVVRGGSYQRPSHELRSAYRTFKERSRRFTQHGIRVARELE